MKFLSAICVLLSAAAMAAEPVAEKVNRTYHAYSKSYGRAEYISLRNDLASYLVYLQWVKPTATKDGMVTIGMPEPVFWQQYVNRDFTSLTVNGINSRTLEPKDVKLFKEKDKAGVDILYNFDGVKMNLRFYMTSKSSLLVMEWSKDPSSEEDIKTISFGISTHPSFSVPHKENDKYRRSILTPARKIAVHQGTGWKELKTTDTGLMMYDEAFEPSNTPKAQGPCYMAINWNGIKSGKVWFGQIYCMSFNFQLDPKASHWQFGLWEYKKPMNNLEFIKMFNANAAQFALLDGKVPSLPVQK